MIAEVGVERVDGVDVVCLRRPQVMNALTGAMLDALREAVTGSSASGIVLAAEGPNFCAGQDLRESGPGVDYGEHLRARYNPLVRALFTSSRPVVAAVKGVATGAGLSLALACQARVLGESARLSAGFARIGLAPDGGLGFTLPRLLGPARALAFLAASEPVDAEEAVRLGLADAVELDGKLVGCAVEHARRLAALPAEAWAATRRLVEPDAAAQLDLALEREAVEQTELGRSEEHQARLRAFRERRPG